MEVLTPEQDCIEKLAALVTAVYFETTDEDIKIFINGMLSGIGAEFQQDTKGSEAEALSVKLFQSEKLVAEFRSAVRLTRRVIAEETNAQNNPTPKLILPKGYLDNKKNGHNKR